ncbi:hypothetical protein MACH26_38580 [Planctobacterium marinum]|uniref:Uncharacterized protein n=1 Tax=Planctobacterium marinum TaxID=1631968 RepID=A0AA48HTC5_9ALTE|nr:hypothetical protein MACH26_38580 [Planctobacterium marinum]
MPCTVLALPGRWILLTHTTSKGQELLCMFVYRSVAFLLAWGQWVLDGYFNMVKLIKGLTRPHQAITNKHIS